MMGAQVYCSTRRVSCFCFLSTLSDFLFVLQLFQQVVATSARLKRHATDLKKANQKIHGLEKELKQTRAALFDARNVAEIVTMQRNQAQQEVA